MTAAPAPPTEPPHPDGHPDARVLVLSGPSGSGKSTVVRELAGACSERIRPCVSATTRPPREGEEDGVDYHFLSDDEFRRRRDAGEFLETAEVHGRAWYGTPWAEVDAAAADGAWALLEIDVVGARSVLARYPDTVTVFLMTSTEEEFVRRLRARGTESEADIARRLETAKAELREADGYLHRVYNDDLSAAVARLCDILRTHPSPAADPAA